MNALKIVLLQTVPCDTPEENSVKGIRICKEAQELGV